MAIAWDSKAGGRRLWTHATTKITKVMSAATKPHKTAITNLAHMPLTLIGTSLIDFAAFHLGNGWGFLATGISCLIIEKMIADEDT